MSKDEVFISFQNLKLPANLSYGDDDDDDDDDDENFI